jgi:hypothetical protein
MSDPGTTMLDRWSRIAQIASAISVILGIVVALFSIYKTSAEIRESSQVTKLNGLPRVMELIEQDAEVRSLTSSWNKEKIAQILARHPNVAEAYHSAEMEPVRKVGHHYEVLGAVVQTNYVDFNLFYRIVDFPDQFWEATEDLRTKAKRNWDGKPLPDFWENFEDLQKLYAQRREEDQKRRDKDNKVTQLRTQ